MKFSEWRARFSDRYKQYVNELTQVGLDTAQMLFNSAPAEYGNGGVEVSREFDGTVNCVIRASGEDAAFVEFGAGVETTVTRPTVAAAFEIVPGSWSAERDGPFSRDGYWYYNGQKLSGTPPAGAMQEACIRMEREAPGLARRIFK